MLKFFDGQTDGRTDRVITIGHPPSGGALIKTLSSSCNLSLPLNYHYEVLFYRTLSKNFYTDYGFL